MLRETPWSESDRHGRSTTFCYRDRPCRQTNPLFPTEPFVAFIPGQETVGNTGRVDQDIQKYTVASFSNYLDDTDLAIGDRVLAVDEQPMSSNISEAIQSLNRLVNTKSEIQMTVERNGETLEINFPVHQDSFQLINHR